MCALLTEGKKALGKKERFSGEKGTAHMDEEKRIGRNLIALEKTWLSYKPPAGQKTQLKPAAPRNRVSAKGPGLRGGKWGGRSQDSSVKGGRGGSPPKKGHKKRGMGASGKIRSLRIQDRKVVAG